VRVKNIYIYVTIRSSGRSQVDYGRHAAKKRARFVVSLHTTLFTLLIRFYITENELHTDFKNRLYNFYLCSLFELNFSKLFHTHKTYVHYF
jgi:hypothetical protein